MRAAGAALLQGNDGRIMDIFAAPSAPIRGPGRRQVRRPTGMTKKYYAGCAGIHRDEPGFAGTEWDSPRRSGIRWDEAGFGGTKRDSPGLSGIRWDSSGTSGIEVGQAGFDGIQVGQAGFRWDKRDSVGFRWDEWDSAEPCAAGAGRSRSTEKRPHVATIAPSPPPAVSPGRGAHAARLRPTARCLHGRPPPPTAPWSGAFGESGGACCFTSTRANTPPPHPGPLRSQGRRGRASRRR